MIQNAKTEQNASTGKPEGNDKSLTDKENQQTVKQQRSAASTSRNKSESTRQNTIQGIHVKVFYTKDFGRNTSTRNTEVMKDEHILQKHAFSVSSSPKKANKETMHHHCTTSTNDSTLHQIHRGDHHEGLLDTDLEKNLSTTEVSSLKGQIEEDTDNPSENISLDMYINEGSIIMKSKISYLSYTKTLTNKVISTNDTRANQTKMSREEKSAEHVPKNQEDIEEYTSTKIKSRVESVERTTNPYTFSAEYHPSKNKSSERIVENSQPCGAHITSISSRDEIYVNRNLLHEEKVNCSLFPNAFPQSRQVLHKDITDDELKQYLEDEFQESITKDIVSSCNQENQAQEINFDDFVEISLEVNQIFVSLFASTHLFIPTSSYFLRDL